MHKLRIKKKITRSLKALDPIFSEAKAAPQSSGSNAAVQNAVTPQNGATPKVQPAVQPASAKPKAPATATNPLATFSISINPDNVGSTKKKENVEEVIEVKNRKEAFSAADLVKAWNTLKATVEQEKLLEQSMKASEPVLKDGGEFEIAVVNPFQEKTLKEHATRIMSFLKDRLRNDTLTMKVVVQEQLVKNQVFTVTDKYKLMVKKNPALEKLRKRLDLELD